jgi:hypothetical protein
MAWCSRCREDFVTYNLATAVCPRCGGRATTTGRRKARSALLTLIVLGVLAGGGIAAYVFLLR